MRDRCGGVGTGRSVCDMKKLYIFDLDGTLVNSLTDLADSVNAVLEKHGYAVHETDEYRFFVGNGALKLIERAMPEDKRTKENIELLHGEFSQEYAKRALDNTAPYEGIKELITQLKKRGCLLAVASNKPEVFSKLIVERIFGEGVFDVIRGKRDGVPIKPDPAILFGIMQELGVNKEDCVHSGDSAVDVMTAVNAGIDVIGCTWGLRPREELVSAGAKIFADEPMDIFRAFDLGE